jgi:hypothetical protein
MAKTQAKPSIEAADGERRCFVIAPIGDPDTEVRRRSDQVLKHIITPAVAECGYRALRADQISEPGIITSQVIQHVVDYPLVVADLTGRNPNVFYELAVRHAIQKPLVQIIKKGETIPFDVAGTRTVNVDHQDLDSVEEAKREIVKQIKAVEQNPKLVDTPISVAIDLQVLRQSDNPEDRSLADIVSAIAEMRAGITGIEKRLSDPSAIIPPDYLDYITRRFGRRSPDFSMGDVADLRGLSRRLAELLAEDRLTADKKDEMRAISRVLLMYSDRAYHDMEISTRPTKG